MSENEVMYLKENINFKYEISMNELNKNQDITYIKLYFSVKIIKPPERKTKILILFFDLLDLVKKIKNIYKDEKKYRFQYLRIYFESYKNSKNVYDNTPKMIYFTNVTDEVNEYFSSTYCESSIICFNMRYNSTSPFFRFTVMDFGFKINYIMNDLKYTDYLNYSSTTNDYFPIRSSLNFSDFAFYFVFAVHYGNIIEQHLIELQNNLNPIVEVGFKELIEKSKLNEKYKQILYLTVLKDDF